MLADSPTTPPKAEANNTLSPILDSSEGDSQDSLERAVLGVPVKLAPSPPALSLEDIGCDSGSENPPQAKREVCKPRKDPPTRGRVLLPETDDKKKKAVRPRSPAVWEKENRVSGKQKLSVKPSSGDGKITRKVSSITGNATKTLSKPAAKATKESTVSKEKPVAKPSIPGGGPRRVPINSADAPAIGKVWKG
jgi:hypothetical protein